MPYLPSLVQKDILINDVILIIKVNDVNLKEKQRQRGEGRVLQHFYGNKMSQETEFESFIIEFKLLNMNSCIRKKKF